MSSIEFHRLARTEVHRWWRPVAGSAFIVAGTLVLAVALAVAVIAAGVVVGKPTLSPAVELILSFLVIALLLPVTLAAARWIQRRPAGTLSSITGRLRWRRLLICLPVAAGATLLLLIGSYLLGTATGMDTGLDADVVGLAEFAPVMAALLVVVPLQAAAEEYLMRGWLLQAVGVWFRRPWVPIVVQAVVFAALHGWGTPWGFADLTVFGLVAGWLTVRTGGLEAAIALHVTGNLAGTGLAAAYGQLDITETAADMPWQMAVVDLPVLIAYAAAVVLILRPPKPSVGAQTTAGPEASRGAADLTAAEV